MEIAPYKGVSMEITDVIQKVHETAKRKGWWRYKRSPLEIHALIHAEISEATEEVRQNKPFAYSVNGKYEGEAIELIDAVIRIFDYFGYNGWDFETLLRLKIRYNETRTYRHGGKRF